MAHGKIQKIEFESCPSCNSELKPFEFGKCSLCGNDLIDLEPEEILALKLEKKRLSSKTKELIDFIEKQDFEIVEVYKEIENLIKKRDKS
jgi:hypothetical protein